MILRLGLSFAAHLLAGLLMGSLGVLAAACLAKRRAPVADAAPASETVSPPG